VPSLRVREARPEDFEPLVALLDQMDDSMYRGPKAGDPAALRALYDAILTDPDQRLLVAELGGRIVGTAHVIVLRHFRRKLSRSAVIEGVMVDPETRRGGVGAALMRAAADFARATGCYKLDLTSNVARGGAHRFYSRLGWKRSHLGYSLELP
jgi:GNAT superfamily N-acetyltransferase